MPQFLFCRCCKSWYWGFGNRRSRHPSVMSIMCGDHAVTWFFTQHSWHWIDEKHLDKPRSQEVGRSRQHLYAYSCICTDHYRRNNLFHHDSVNTHLVEGQHNIIPVNKKGSESEKIQSSPCFRLNCIFKSLWEDWLWSNILCNRPFAFSKSLWSFEGSLLLYCSHFKDDRGLAW